MAGVAQGKKGTYHSHHGDVSAQVVEYEAGRDSGDHYIAGFSLPGQMSSENGPTFARWVTVGDKEGQFEPA